MAKEFVIKHGLIVHGEITGSDVRIDDWNSISASLAELNSNVGETVTTASIVGNVITFTKSDGTTFDTVVQEDTGSFFTSASVDLNTITFHYADNTSGSLSVETGTTLIRVKNTSGGAISKGTPVYITGNVGATDMLQIAPADASDASKMPAVGLLLTDLGINGEGFVVQGGYLTGMVTDTIDGTSTTSNDTVYVKAGGGLTMTKPTGDTNYIQNIAKIARVHGTAGSLVVSSILRTNDVPNLPTGKIWVGDGNTVTSSFVHLDEANNRIGINTDTPASALHIQGQGQPIRLTSDSNTQMYVRYQNRNSTDQGIRVGNDSTNNTGGGGSDYGADNFVVQWDSGNPSSNSWQEMLRVSSSGEMYVQNLPTSTTVNVLYYDPTTGEVTYGTGADTGSFFTSASVDYNRVTFTSGDGTTSTITIDTGSFEPDRQDTGSFFTSASVDFNRVTFTQGDGTTEVITVHTGSKATPAGSNSELQFNDNGEFGASQYLTYNGKRLEIDSQNSAPALRLSASLNDAVNINFRAQNTVNNGIQVGSRGANDFFVQQDATSGAASNWNVNLFISQSGAVFLGNIGNQTTTSQLYYNAATKEVTSGPLPSGADTGSFYISSSVDSNRITFTQGDGTTEVVTVDTGSKATPAGSSTELQFNNAGAFGATTGITYTSSPQRLDLDTTSILIEGKSVPIQLTEGSTSSKQTVISYAQSTTSNVGFRVGNNDLGDTGRDIFVIAHGTTDWQASNTTNIFELDQAGSLILSAYGSGNFTGTATRYLAVDADGNLIEESVPSGGGTIDTGSFYVSSSSDQDTLRLFQADGTSVTHDLYDPRTYISSSVDLNRITFTQRDGSTEIVTVHTGSGLTGNGVTGQIALWDASKRLNGDSHLVWNPLSNRMGINIASPESNIHIDGYGQPIRLTSSTNTQMYVRYQNQNSTSEGIRVGNDSTNNTGGGGSDYGADNFVVQWDSGNPSSNSWQEMFRVSSSGEMYVQNLPSSTTSNTLYYNSTTGEVTYGAAPSGGGTIDTGSFYVSSSVDLNRITFTQGDGTTEVVTVHTGSAGGGGGSGTVNSGVAGYLAYYPSNGTTVDDQSGLFWDESSGELGIGTTNPARPLHIDSTNAIPIRLSSTTANRQAIQYYGANSTGAGVIVGTEGENDFVLLQTDFVSASIHTNLYVSESGEAYFPRLGTSTTSDVVYYNSTTGELTYGSAPSGGTDTTIYSTNGTLSGNRTLNGGSNSLTFNNLSGFSVSNATTVSLEGPLYLSSITNATKSDVLYLDTTTGEVTYGTAPGGSGSPGGSTTQVQFNDAGSFGGDAGLVYDKTNDRLGIGGTGTPSNTLHLAGDSEAVYLDGSTGTQTSQYLKISTNGSGADYRLGLGYTSPTNVFTIDNYNGTSWDTHFKIHEAGYVDLPSLQSTTTSNVVYYDTTSGRLSYGTAPGGGSGTPGGSTTQVQFNDGGSFGGDAGLVYDKTNDRLGIGGTTPTTTLHLSKEETPIFLDGTSATQANQYIRVKPNGESNNGIRFGAGYSSVTGTSFEIDHHASSTWTTKFSLRGSNGSLTLAGYASTSLTGNATDYVLAPNASGTVVKIPITYSATGRYGFGTTNPTAAKLQVQGNVSGVSIYASNDIVAYSDARSKVNVETIPNALEKVNAIRGVTYNKVEDPEGIRYMGVIAQELLEHLPEVVHQGEEGNYSVAYGNVVGVLIEAVKELTAKVEDLESRLGK